MTPYTLDIEKWRKYDPEAKTMLPKAPEPDKKEAKPIEEAALWDGEDQYRLET